MEVPELLPAPKRRLVQKLELAQKSKEFPVSIWIRVGPPSEETIGRTQAAVAGGIRNLVCEAD